MFCIFVAELTKVPVPTRGLLKRYYNCDDLGRKWSQTKKSWCCTTEHRGCPGWYAGVSQ